MRVLCWSICVNNYQSVRSLPSVFHSAVTCSPTILRSIGMILSSRPPP
ncbi:Uncharacterised protein [Vibrio cholerae]|nr:Uncharacterised protein [Vibrio cholerae]